MRFTLNIDQPEQYSEVVVFVSDIPVGHMQAAALANSTYEIPLRLNHIPAGEHLLRIAIYATGAYEASAHSSTITINAIEENELSLPSYTLVQQPTVPERDKLLRLGIEDALGQSLMYCHRSLRSVRSQQHHYHQCH